MRLRTNAAAKEGHVCLLAVSRSRHLISNERQLGGGSGQDCLDCLIVPFRLLDMTSPFLPRRGGSHLQKQRTNTNVPGNIVLSVSSVFGCPSCLPSNNILYLETEQRTGCHFE